MKLIIEVTEDYYAWLKEKVNDCRANVSDITILDGKPYEEKGKCKTCKYYHPYYERSEPRGDGYCVIARMTPEGLTTINCNDEFGCSDYQEKQGAKNVF